MSELRRSVKSDIDFVYHSWDRHLQSVLHMTASLICEAYDLQIFTGPLAATAKQSSATIDSLENDQRDLADFPSYCNSRTLKAREDFKKSDCPVRSVTHTSTVLYLLAFFHQGSWRRGGEITITPADRPSHRRRPIRPALFAMVISVPWAVRN